MIELYINNRLADIDNGTEILYNYQTDELNNPTVVKNSFSKTITLKGTSINNQIFGEYWNLERLQTDRDFNASKKLPFQVYVDADIYESGYVKLNNVRKENGLYLYEVTLYGGLGDFFYNLSTTDDGREMKLSDLEYEYDLDFTINKETVKEAWDALEKGTKGKWQTINFMTAYNGLPDDFDADKCIINIDATSLEKERDGFKSKGGWVLGELPTEMTEWEIRDLRSYLQRPVIRMKKVIEACCDPKNNGGYTVDLDPDFFNEENPYWESTYLTLPMIQNLEYGNEEQILEDSQLISGSNEGDVNDYMYENLNFTLGEFGGTTPKTISVDAKIKIDVVGGTGLTSYVWFWNKNGDSFHSKWGCLGALFCQLLAFNGDVVVGASNAYCLTSPVRHNGKLYYGENSDFSRKFTPYMNKPISVALGDFKGSYFRTEGYPTAREFNFTISGVNTNITSLKMCYYWGAASDKLNKATANTIYSDDADSGWTSHNKGGSRYKVPVDGINAEIISTNLKAVAGKTIGRSGTKVSKNLILSTEGSPCDYLLSYCKMFGLYFSKDINQNIIHIQTRKTFYNRDKVYDLTEIMDKGKEYNIVPLAFDSKWVEFSQEKDETYFSQKYLSSKGIDYGCKVLNTGYEFNSEKKPLLEDNVIKSGIEGLERSQFYTAYNNDRVCRPWFGLGLKYNLYKGEETLEVYGSNSQGNNLLGVNEGEGMKYYDTFPKLQFRDEENSPTDGNNVLVFFSGMKNITTNRANPLWYWLTDDSHFQTLFNEANPCWLYTTSQLVWDGNKWWDIALKVDKLPVFERYLTTQNGIDVKKSLDFGSPQEMYIPDYRLTDDVNIYSNFWKTYLEDLYSVNTRILTAFINLNGKPSIEWLKSFYWFDNTVWRINKIIDWKIGGTDTTKVEFVKVQDMEDYTSVSQKRPNDFKIDTEKPKIDYGGEEILIEITDRGLARWKIISDSEIVFTKSEGVGNETITAYVPQNPNPTETKYYYITAIADDGSVAKLTLSQGYPNETKVTTDPQYLLVPYDGGQYNVNTIWTNQGENQLNDYTEDIDNVDVQFDNYNIYVNVGENENNTVKSGTITFNGNGYTTYLEIEQLPESIHFDMEGGNHTLYFENPNVEIIETPYWITVDGYTLIAEPNYYPNERSGIVKASYGGKTADLRVYQPMGEIPVQEIQKVSPMTLYYGLDGGDRYVSINIPNSWYISETIDWVETNIVNGDEAEVIRVSVPQNDGTQRTATFKIIDAITKEEYVITVIQIGSDTNRTFTITPSSIDASKDGGDYVVTISYSGRNGDFVGVDSDGLTVTDLKWVGDEATIIITVPKNETIYEKTFNVSFTCSMGIFILPIIQERFEAILTLSPTEIEAPSEGGEYTIILNSNVEWDGKKLISLDWVYFTPRSGESGESVLNIIVEPNESISIRRGRISFEDENGVLNTLSISQIGVEEILSVSPSVIYASSNGGVYDFNITNNTVWNIEIIE